MEISSHSQFDRHMCTQIGGIYIIKLRALSGDVFSSAWALNPSYAFVYLSATFHCLLSTCVNQSCETEWCVDSHASVSIWLSQQLNGEMPKPMDKCLWTNEQAQQWQARVMHYLLKGCGRMKERRPFDTVTV